VPGQSEILVRVSESFRNEKLKKRPDRATDLTRGGMEVRENLIRVECQEKVKLERVGCQRELQKEHNPKMRVKPWKRSGAPTSNLLQHRRG